MYVYKINATQDVEDYKIKQIYKIRLNQKIT